MKKLLLLLGILFVFLLPSCDIDSPIDEGYNESYVKTSDTMKIKDFTISSESARCYITPVGFDYEELEGKRYSKMNITVEYYVTYKKTWDKSLNFLYDGAPKYYLEIKDSNEMGIRKSGLKTTKTATRQSYSVAYNLVDLKDNQIMLEIGSSNIQNDVIFTNIVIYYKCK